MKRKWAVYDVCANGEILYVGCSCKPKGRLASHKWRRIVPYFATIRIVARYATREKALAAERERIIELNPPRNVVHSPERRTGNRLRPSWMMQF